MPGRHCDHLRPKWVPATCREGRSNGFKFPFDQQQPFFHTQQAAVKLVVIFLRNADPIILYLKNVSSRFFFKADCASACAAVFHDIGDTFTKTQAQDIPDNRRGS